ncbi:MAG TPA: DNA mismatch repair endonuclease MutL, partial [Caldimonas sp.]
MNAVLEPRVRRPIRELPSELVSQIAAGEVVERPASVVRELLDNAVDAGAMAIVVRLAGGGIRAIAVEDDGHGIPADELAVALRRHATSKISSLAELEGVATMGFRGEALAAIASIAEVSLTSRGAEAAHATRLDARTGEIGPAARSVGTTVEVRELFFNTPARRKFLKTEATELAHCLEAVRRHALVRPDLSFAVWHDGKAVARWARATPAARADELLGATFAEHSRAVAVDLGGLAISGRTGTPESARARADLQYVYVNGRHVRDKLIAHAVRAAYEDVLHGGRQPAYLLFIEVAPERVDVNVHPTKIEVRFRDSREVHEAVRKAVGAALAAAPGARGASPAAASAASP